MGSCWYYLNVIRVLGGFTPPTTSQPMASTLRNLLLKGALLTSTGIAALYAGSASAFVSCTLGTLGACTGSSSAFSISNVTFSGSGGSLVASTPVTFTQGTGSNGKPSLIFNINSGTSQLQRIGTFSFLVNVIDPDPLLTITGYNSISTNVPGASTAPRGGTFDLTYAGNLIETGSVANTAGQNANPSLSLNDPLSDDCPPPGCTALNQVFSTVAVAIGYNYSVVGNQTNRPNSLSGVFTTDVPLPLPVVGAGFAFGFTRKLRQRAKLAS